MIPTNTDLKNFYISSPYQDMLHQACATLGIELDEEFPDVLYTHDKKKIECARLDLNDLNRTLADSRPALLKFIFLKFEGSRNDDAAGEFPPREEQEQADNPALAGKLEAYRNFLLLYLIEFTLMQTREKDIVPYLKCVRIPFATAYAERLKQWFRDSHAE